MVNVPRLKIVVISRLRSLLEKILDLKKELHGQSPAEMLLDKKTNEMINAVPALVRADAHNKLWEMIDDVERAVKVIESTNLGKAYPRIIVRMKGKVMKVHQQLNLLEKLAKH